MLLLSSVSHLLYSDDTQLFVSFVPKNFSSAINNLQSTITLISSWMSSNYLTLNPSKTEFLLISHTQQASKIVNPSLSLPSTKPITPSLSAKNLGFIFDSTRSFSKQISSLFSACHYHIRDIRRIRHTLDSTTATTIATALVNSRLDYCNRVIRRRAGGRIQRRSDQVIVSVNVNVCHRCCSPKTLHLPSSRKTTYLRHGLLLTFNDKSLKLRRLDC